ncbi:MAG: regulatory protein RecX [Vicinamibacterales bacterium]
MADSTHAAYVAGLTMLARRELSEQQVRQRLLRRGHGAEEVDAAIDRLKAERAIDDARVAESIARTEVALRRRGRLRVDRRIQQAGIAGSTARRAVDAVYGDIDPDALLDQALRKRLKPSTDRSDPKVFQRLYRYLIGQGFEADRVLGVLRRVLRTPDGA